MPSCVILNSRYPDFTVERSVLEPLGITVLPVAAIGNVSADRLNEAEVMRAAENADAVLVNLAPFTSRVIDALPRLRVISRYGVGLDNIDTEYAQSKGIAVCNVPDYCTAEVAEHTLALMLDLLRGVSTRNSGVKQGHWNKEDNQYTLRGQTLGIIGYGAIARAVIERAIPFGPGRILVYSRHAEAGRIRADSLSVTVTENPCPASTSREEQRISALSELYGVPLDFVPLDSLLESSTIISLHCSLSPKTRHLLDTASFSSMKKGTFIINTARGGLIDFKALAEAVKRGIVAGAGLDVFETEPPDDILEQLRAPEFLVSDHTAFRSVSSIGELKRRCAENAARSLGLI